MAEDTEARPPLGPDAKVEPKQKPAKPRPLGGVPLASFVQLGTTTSGHDQLLAAQLADADRRRAEDDAERRLADEHGLHRGNPADVASRYTSTFTEHPEIQKAYVPLRFMGRGGKGVEYEGVGDIIMPQDPAFDDELALLIYCPVCLDRRRLPPAHSIIMVRQSNRRWHLDERGAGEMFVWEGQAYRSAGTIRDSERFTCPRCPFRARIDDNRVIPE